MKQKIIAGNWKMNLSMEEGLDLVKNITASKSNNERQILIFPTFLHIPVLANLLTDKIKLGAQNFYPKENGAYTGEVSLIQLKNLGVEYVLIGHSERRMYFHENESFLKEKVDFALQHQMKIVFCCGEPLTEREGGFHFNFVKKQLEASLFHLPVESLSMITIAYEPIWAIGTGVTATTAQAEEMHEAIRTWVEEKYNRSAAENISILYGGSCNDKNAKELFDCPNIDGGLIGGAALKADSFLNIINA